MTCSLRSLGLSLPFFILASCGGTVAAPTGEATPPAGDRSPVGTRAPEEEAPSVTPAPRPAPSCQTRPGGTSGIASCAVAKESLVVEPLGIRWTSGAPWEAGARGVVRIRYSNDSPTDAIHYPSLALSSSDARVEGASGKHLAEDGYFHPDFYALLSCAREETGHAFDVQQTVPSGTTIRFNLAVAVATGNGISSCGGTLAPTHFDVLVP